MTNLTTELKYVLGADIDLKHGAIVAMKVIVPEDEEAPPLILNIETVAHYYTGQDGKTYLSENSTMRQVQDHAYWLSSVIDDWLYHSRWPFPSLELNETGIPLAIEYDINRVHFRGARKKSMVQLGHMMGAFISDLETDNPEVLWKLYKPHEKRRVLKEKAETWVHFASQTGFMIGEAAVYNLPEIDAEGDIPDAAAVAMYHLLEERGDFEEQNARLAKKKSRKGKRRRK